MDKMQKIAKTFCDICTEEGLYFHGVLIDGMARSHVVFAGDNVEIDQQVRMISELSKSTTILLEEVFMEDISEDNE